MIKFDKIGLAYSFFALVFCWVPIMNVVLFFFGLVFSIIGLIMNKPKQLSICGLGISVIEILSLITLKYFNYI